MFPETIQNQRLTFRRFPPLFSTTASMQRRRTIQHHKLPSGRRQIEWIGLDACRNLYNHGKMYGAERTVHESQTTRRLFCNLPTRDSTSSPEFPKQVSKLVTKSSLRVSRRLGSFMMSCHRDPSTVA